MYFLKRLLNWIFDTYEILSAQSQFKADMWMRTAMCCVLIVGVFAIILLVLAVRFVWTFLV